MEKQTRIEKTITEVMLDEEGNIIKVKGKGTAKDFKNSGVNKMRYSKK